MKRFGRFLYDRGLISASALAEAVEAQGEAIVPLGTLAVEGSFMTSEQVDELWRVQRSHDRRFGEIAVERQWLDKDQVRGLLAAQTERRVRLGELLVHMGHLTEDELTGALNDFEVLHARHNERLMLLLQSDLSNELIRAFLEFTAKHFLRTTCEPVKVVSITFEQPLQVPSPADRAAYIVSQAAEGDREFTCGLLLGEPLVLRLASLMLQEEQREIDELVVDSVCEFLNMTVGNCFGHLYKQGIRLRPHPPQFARAADAAATFGACTRVEMLSRPGDFDVVISLASGSRGASGEM